MGQRFVVEASGSSDGGASNASPQPVHDVVDFGNEAKQLAQWRKELEGYHAENKGCSDLEPDDAMRWIAATSARLVEMRSQAHDMRSPRATALRTKHIDPLIHELGRQFDIASRRHSVYEFEMKMTRGMV